jgi:hypothetical protein
MWAILDNRLKCNIKPNAGGANFDELVRAVRRVVFALRQLTGDGGQIPVQNQLADAMFGGHLSQTDRLIL